MRPRPVNITWYQEAHIPLRVAQLAHTHNIQILVFIHGSYTLNLIVSVCIYYNISVTLQTV